MTKKFYIILAASSLTALAACTKEGSELEYTLSNSNSGGAAASGDTNGQGSSFTSNYSPAFTDDVLNLNIAFDNDDIKVYGDVTETVPAEETDKDYEDYVQNFNSQHTVTITYSDGNATVSGGDMAGVNIATSGADVTVNSTIKGITYVLTGSASNGSFKMAAGTDDKKFGLVLQDLTLTKSGGSAINIQSSKRCYLQLLGDNTLGNTGKYSGTEEDQKGCIFSEGKLLISGSGTLSATSVTMHAIASDDYVWVHSGPTLHLKTYGKDGIHANDSVVVSGGKTFIETVGDGIQVDELTGNYVQKGGFVRIHAARDDDENDNSHGVKSAGGVILEGGALQVTVTDTAAKAVKADGDISVTGGKQTLITTGNGTYDSEDADTKASAGLSAEGSILISGGDIRCKSTGSGGKGIKAEGTLTVDNGCTVRITTSGKRYSYGSLHSSPKGIKSEGKMTINGGTIAVKLTGTGDGTEAIESKDAITVNDGFIAASSYDDAINSKLDFTMNGGYLFAQGLNNDALDANRNLYVNGGTILASGGAQPENAIDAAEGYSIYINGGWTFAVGGSTAQTASSSQQASIAFSSNVSGKTIGLFDSNGKGLMAVTMPSTSCSSCYMTAPGMTAGNAYTVTNGVSVSGGTTWCGMNVTGSISGGSTLTSATAALSVGQGMGGGQPGGGGGPGGGRPW